MVPIFQALDRLPVNLRGGDNPQDKASPAVEVDHVHKVNSFDGKQCFSASSGDFEAECRQWLSKPILGSNIRPLDLRLLPCLGWKINLELRVLLGLFPPCRKVFEVAPYCCQSSLLVILKLHGSPRKLVNLKWELCKVNLI